MKCYLLPFLFLCVILQRGIHSLTINILNGNQISSIGLKTTDVIPNSPFQLFINGTNCYVSDIFNLQGSGAQSYTISTSPNTWTTTCDKANLLATKVIDNNNFQVNLSIPLKVGGNYYLNIISSGVFLRSQSFPSLDAKSGSVTIVAATSSYPNLPIKVTWTVPAVTNGQIVQYIVLIQSTPGNTCTLWTTPTCSDCITNNAGTLGDTNIRTNCPSIPANPYSVNDPTISVALVSTLLLPVTQYNVSVIPINGYGWGTQSSINFVTSQYMSGSVTNEAVSSTPDLPINVTWVVPTVTNGQIVQYIVLIQSLQGGTCVVWKLLTCSDCANNNTGTIGDTNVRTGCTTIPSQLYSTNSPTISAPLSSTVLLSAKQYKVSVIPINGYGWGTWSSIMYTTPSKSGAVRNLGASSNYPNLPIQVTWTVPAVPNGQIIQYLVTIEPWPGTGCIIWTVTTSADYNSYIADTTSYLTSSCPMITSNTFSTTASTIAVSLVSLLLLPATDYKVSVTPINEYGWGTNTFILYKFEYMSGAVTNEVVTSSFPNLPMKVTWAVPTVTNGQIVQYFVLLQSLPDNVCALLAPLSCSDCANNNPQTIGGMVGNVTLVSKCPQIQPKTFSLNDLTLSASLISPLVLPYTKYTVSVIPINGYGFGNQSSVTFVTPEYVSGPVSNEAVSSIYPSIPMKVSWTVPTVPSGQIVQYLVVIQPAQSSGCLLWMTLICSDCTINIAGSTGDTNIRNNCPNLPPSTYSTTASKLSVPIVSTLILPATSYKVSVIPVNGYGWGTWSSIIYTTPYVSGAVTNEAISSIFPATPMTVSWTVPTVPNGQIVQYIVWIQSTPSNVCVLWTLPTCADCANNDVGSIGDTNIRTSCPSVTSTTYSTSVQTISVMLVSPLVLPKTQYNVYVVPINGYGWGSPSSLLFTTPGMSDPVTNEAATSSYPNTPMTVTWTVPTVTNGQIVQYLVLIQSSPGGACVLWKLLTCSDCTNNNVGTVGDTNIRTNCPNLPSTTYSKTPVTISVPLASPLLIPLTQYKVSVVPINAYGWGTQSFINYTTPFVSGSVVNETATSSFPNSPIKVSWTVPNVTNGQIVQYLVSIQSSSGTGCILWELLICLDCTNNGLGTVGDTNIRTGCPMVAINTYSMNDLTISAPFVSPLLLPVTKYKVSVIPINGYGWGNLSSILFTTAQYISNAVTNGAATSVYPNWPMNVSWTVPAVTNGQIVQYIVFLQSTAANTCNLWTLVNCTNCTDNNPGNVGDTNIRTNCPSLPYSTFSTTSLTISVSLVSDLVLPATLYTLSVVPVNGYGWGNTFSILYTTPGMSGPVTNEAAISIFPSSPMTVTWSVPTGPNGKIVQYLMVIQSSPGGVCVLWTLFTCSDCANKNVGTTGVTNIIANCPSTTNNTFLTAAQIISASLVSNLILPVTQYKVSVIPINAYGWGSLSSIDFTTPGMSGPVILDLPTSSYPDSPIKLTWSVPVSTNGQIVQYLVLIIPTSGNGCVLWTILSCSDCTNNNAGSVGDTNIRTKCPSIVSNPYLSSSSKISVTLVSPLLLPATQYSISVVPINAYGWGTLSSINFLTAQYISYAVTNEAVTSLFLNLPLQVTWSVPIVTNGQIVQYLVLIQSTAANTCNLYTITQCSDCPNTNAGAIGDTNIRASCLTIAPSSFSTSATTISTTIVSSVVLPATQYNVSVIPINGYGWGSGSSTMITTPGVSDAVTAVTAKSLFPNSAISVSWTVPTVTNGQIVQYIVVIQSSPGATCLLWALTSCSDCTNNNPGTAGVMTLTDNCPSITISGYSKSATTITATLVSPLLLPVTQYTIIVVPINAYGWGIPAALSYLTDQSASAAVSNLAATSLFPGLPMQVSWTIPTVTNGPIVQYLVVLQNAADNKCVMFSLLSCSDCTNNNAGTNGDTKIRTGCSPVTSPSYSTSAQTISVSFTTSLVKPAIQYTVSVIPINGYGWGNALQISFTTSQFTSNAVEQVKVGGFNPIVVTWVAPTITNGQIVQYLVLLSSGGCIQWTLMNCSDCANNNPGTNGVLSSTNNCPSFPSYTYSTTLPLFSISLSSPSILPGNTYSILVVPINGYGYGTGSSNSYTTPSVSSPVVGLAAYSIFSMKPIQVQWVPPSTPNGKIVQYLVVIQSATTNECIVTKYMTCTDCPSNQIGTGGALNIADNCPTIPADMYKYTDLSVTAPISYDSLSPATQYTIVVIPINAYGWGNIATMPYTTSSASNAVTIMEVYSSFPSIPLTVTWNAPTVANGIIVQYIVLVKSPTSGACIVWVPLKCKDCDVKDPGTLGDSSPISGCPSITPSSFAKSSTSIPALFLTSLLTPITQYTIAVVPVNGYGWGAMVSINYLTPPYKSNAVISPSATSSYPASPMTLTWTAPGVTNGQIVKYLVVLNSASGCVLTASPSCSDCASTTAGTADMTTIADNCGPIIVDGFSQNNQLISVTLVSPLVLPATQYKAIVVPINAYGWGTVTSIVYSTAQYISNPVTSLAAISQYPNAPIKVSWTPPQVSNGQIVQYLVMVQTTSNVCVLWTLTTCSDCTNTNAGTTGDTNIKANCPSITSTPYSKATPVIGVSLVSPLLVPLTSYTILVVPINGYGWGPQVTANCVTGQYVSGAVTNVAATSNYPATPMTLSWTVPAVNSGQIVQYLVLVQATSANTCILWTTTSCTDCTPNNPGSNGVIPSYTDNCPPIPSNGYSSTGMTLSIPLVSPLLLTATKYKVTVIPINGYGWGDPSSIDYTILFKSGMPQNLVATSSFPNFPIKVTWTVPTVTNGQIIQYIVSLMTLPQRICVMWTSVNCSDCANNIVGSVGDTNIRSTCPGISSNTYLTSLQTISASFVSPLVLPATSYEVQVTPINGYGWGDLNVIPYATPGLSDPVTNEAATSIYSSAPMKVTWTVPIVTNGQIVQYILVLEAGGVCVLWTTTSCSDCTDNNVGSVGDTNIRNNCQTIASNTYLKSAQTISLTLVSPLVSPATQFKVSVFPINGYGWGTQSSILFTTPGISGAVINEAATSLYPNLPMKVTWTVPTATNGQIVQYLVVIQASSGTSCIVSTLVTCSDCPNKDIGTVGVSTINVNCQNIGTNTYSMNDLTISVSLISPLLLPATQYKVSVIPINAYGWGNKSSILFTTAPYISEPVTNEAALSVYPNLPIKVSWTVPALTNGQIVQYLLLIQSSDTSACVLWTLLICYDCAKNDTGVNGDTNIRTNCISTPFNNFSTNAPTLSASVTYSLLFPATTYKVSVIPINGYGWGKLSFITYTTPGVSGPVTNEVATSSFPDFPMQVTWAVPTVTNGQIVQYILLIQSTPSNACLLWTLLNCTDCNNNAGTVGDTNIRTNCTSIPSNTYSTNSPTITVSIVTPLLLPATQYKVSVFPINAYGWGTQAYINFVTGHYVSGAVTNIAATSCYANSPMQVTWTVPALTNGQIVQYLVVIQSTQSKACVVWTLVYCSDCTSNIAGTKGDTNIRFNCPSILSNTFSTSAATSSVPLLSALLLPATQYQILVIPINAYGWGNQASINYMTPGPSSPVSNEAATSSFPNWPINVTWTAPTVSIFQIVQYVVVVQNPTNQLCLAWSSIKCSNCINNCVGTLADTNIRTNCPGSPSIGTYSQSGTIISLPIVSSLLLPWTAYNVSVVPVNAYGWGNVATMNYTTAPTYPTAVNSFSCARLSYTAFTCTWMPPDRLNDRLGSYNLSCVTNASIGISFISSSLAETINGARTDTNYACTIMACNSVGCGPTSQTNILIPSGNVTVEEPVAVASTMALNPNSPTWQYIPIILPFSSVAERNGNIKNFSLIVCVKGKFNIETMPRSSYGTYLSCDRGNLCPYVIKLSIPAYSKRVKRSISDSPWSNQPFNVGDNSGCSSGSNCNGPLMPRTAYSIGFSACTASDCTVIQMSKSTTIEPYIIAVPVILGIFLIVAVIVGYLRRKRFPCYKNKSDTGRTPMNSPPASPTPPDKPCEHFPTWTTFHDNPVYFGPVKTESNLQASQDYDKLNQFHKDLIDGGKLVMAEGNVMKDRYGNIKCYTHNIIRLEGEEDYINASKICLSHCCIDSKHPCDCIGYYIATQGPIGHNFAGKMQTMGDFWKMVLQYGVSVIVNLTQCVENGREKCAQYWPDSGEQTYISGKDRVRVLAEDQVVHQSCIERRFNVSMTDKTKSVRQLHYLGWNDHKCPDKNDFFEFYNQYRGLKGNNDVVLVHCSNGVGRTGTFILIDAIIKNIDEGNNTIEIFNTLLKLRDCRCSMVQTEKQYVFVNEVIDEYYLGRQTTYANDDNSGQLVRIRSSKDFTK